MLHKLNVRFLVGVPVFNVFFLSSLLEYRHKSHIVEN